MFCDKCGNKILADSKFCSKCGKKIVNPPKEVKTKNGFLNPKKEEKPIRKTPQHEKIDINAVYEDLKRLMEKRSGLQEYQDNLWTKIKRDKINKSTEMTNITKKIGDCNHNINLVISKLTNYKKRHSAMKLAYDFVTSEIERNIKILDKWNRTIHEVDHGYASLINSDGRSHRNTTNSRVYVAKIQEKIQRYRKIQSHLINYI